MADIQRYLDGIESQHKTKPKFMASLEKALTKVDGATELFRAMPLLFYVKTAVGKQLDVVGMKVGVDRRFPPISIPGYSDFLDDETYRQVILSRIVMNQWDGSNEKFREIWDDSIGSTLNAVYRDNQDMTMDMQIIGQIDPALLEMILRGYIIPKPMGVRMSVTVTQEVRTDGDSVTAILPANGAKITLRYPLDDIETQPQLEQATLFPANNAKITMRYPTGDQEAQQTLGQAAAFPVNIAAITVPAV